MKSLWNHGIGDRREFRENFAYLLAYSLFSLLKKTSITEVTTNIATILTISKEMFEA